MKKSLKFTALSLALGSALLSFEAFSAVSSSVSASTPTSTTSLSTNSSSSATGTPANSTSTVVASSSAPASNTSTTVTSSSAPANMTSSSSSATNTADASSSASDANAAANNDTTTASPAPDMTEVSYIMGYQMGGSAKNQKIDLDADAFSEGVSAGFAGTPSKYSGEESKAAMEAFQSNMESKMVTQQNQAADQNQKASATFMAKIANESGVIKIADGLYYKVVKAGNGPIPSATDNVKVNYSGSLIDGTVFDSSYKRGNPVSFGVSQVIAGWSQALQKMPVGSTWTVYIAPDLAYGKFAPPVIGPNQALIFKIELLGINQ